MCINALQSESTFFNKAIFSFRPGRCSWRGRVRGSMTPINLPRAGVWQWHYHTNTLLCFSQSGRGAFTAPHELESIKQGGSRLDNTLLPFRIYSQPETLSPLCGNSSSSSSWLWKKSWPRNPPSVLSAPAKPWKRSWWPPKTTSPSPSVSTRARKLWICKYLELMV